MKQQSSCPLGSLYADRLQLGRSQAPSLGPAFQIFHDLSLNLAVFERQHTLLTLGTPAKEYLGKLYAALHNLVADVATCYQEKIKGSSSHMGRKV